MIRRPFVACLCIGVLLLVSRRTEGQTIAPLTSNRPGVGESEALVSAGVVQVEAGIEAQHVAGDGRHWSQTFGQSTVRLGIAPRVELFASWAGLSRHLERLDAETRTIVSAYDVQVGSKLALLDEERQWLTVSVAPAVSLPIGSDQLSSRSYDAALRVMWARALPRYWSVSGNVSFARTVDDAGRYWERLGTLSASRALTTTLSAFAELCAVGAPDRHGKWTMDAGLAWVAGPDVQWDISAGRTSGDRAAEWFISAGVTLRRR